MLKKKTTVDFSTEYYSGVLALINDFNTDVLKFDELIVTLFKLSTKENAKKAGAAKKTITPERALQLKSYGFQKGKNPKEKRS